VTAVGYTLSAEESGPRELVAHAARAEEVGFPFAVISDHFHPWIDRQGQSPFVWGVLGAVAKVTDRLELATGVTCPTTRMHPAIVAQAAATAAALLPGRFSEAGYDHVYVHQVGPDQEGFFDFYSREVLPNFR
jgi:coenzyme F420-dependent glucose-6-phosphate dehydrogenase